MSEKERERRRRVRASSLAASCLLAVLAAGCAPEDLSNVPTRELVVRIAAQMDRPSADSPGARASHELRARPDAPTTVELLALVRDPDAGVRSVAAQWLGDLAGGLADDLALDPASRSKIESELLALLDDPKETVRSSALYGLSHLWRAAPPIRVPDRFLASIEEQLVSNDSFARFCAALAAMWIGPLARGRTPSLLTALERETDRGIRLFLMQALGSCGVADDHTVEKLTKLLADPELMVRFTAASTLGKLAPAAATAIPELRARFADVAEADDVRAAAAEALARLVTAVEDVEAVLPLLLESSKVFGHTETAWLSAIGNLAAAAPRVDAALAARKRLEEVVRAGDEDSAPVAASSLAKIACATRDVRLAASSMLVLRGAIPNAEAYEGSRTPFRTEVDLAVLEALVELSSWHETGMDAATIRPVLERMAEHRYWWMRAWAAPLLARLK